MADEESALPILSVVRYTGPDYDELFISLQDGATWNGSHQGHNLMMLPDDGPDAEFVTDGDGRVVGIILRDAKEAHPSLLAIAEQRTYPSA